jgi:hypothetical protein
VRSKKSKEKVKCNIRNIMCISKSGFWQEDRYRPRYVGARTTFSRAVRAGEFSITSFLRVGALIAGRGFLPHWKWFRHDHISINAQAAPSQMLS